MNTYDTTFHPELAVIKNFAPTLVKLINSEVTLVISDTEKIICQIVDSELNFGDDSVNKEIIEESLI